MGLLNILSPITNLFGGGEKPAPVQTPAAVEPAQKTPSEIAAEEDQKKKAALIAMNASGSNNGQTTVGGGNADVTRRVLLGL